MRRAARIDANQQAVVSALRQLGASVECLHRVGNGCPDLLVGFRNRTLLLEVKDGTKPPCDRKLTEDQRRWHAAWQGQKAVVASAQEAVAVVLNATFERAEATGRRVGSPGYP